MDSRRPRNYLLLTILATTLAIVMLMLLAEGGVRLRQWLKHGQAGTVDSLLHRDAGSGLRVPRPGVHSGKIHINSLGFRGPEIAASKPALRLAFLGASTTFCAEASRDETTWPHLVAQGLGASFPDLSMDYVNAGVPGYVVEDTFDNWRHRVASLKPDAVVIYHATNDLSLDTRKLAVERGLLTQDREETGWLAEHSMLWFLVEKSLQAKSAQQAAVSDKPRIMSIPPELPQGFKQRLLRLVKTVQSTGTLVVLPTFSYRLRREQGQEAQLASAESALYYMPYMSLGALLEGYEAYNQAIRQVAEETGALLVEGELGIPGDATHFTDSVHFTDAGNAAMARRLNQALLRSPQFKAGINRSTHTRNEAETRGAK
jgi:lysophospholipase L1-like esterase